MSVKKSKRGKENSGKKKVLITILKSSIAGALIFFLLLLIASRAILKFDIDSSLFSVFAFASAAVSAFAAGFIAVRPTRKNGIPMGAVAVVPILILIAIVTAIASGSLGSNLLIAAAIMIVSGAIGGITATNARRKKSRR